MNDPNVELVFVEESLLLREQEENSRLRNTLEKIKINNAKLKEENEILQNRCNFLEGKNL